MGLSSQTIERKLLELEARTTTLEGGTPTATLPSGSTGGGISAGAPTDASYVLADLHPSLPNAKFGYSVVNVKDFGAQGTSGLGNDTEAVQAALAAAGQGQLVVFPPGDYGIWETLVVDAKQRLVGTSGVPVSLWHNFNGPLIDFQGGGGGVSDLTLYNGGTYPGAAVRCVSTASDHIGFIRLDNLNVTGIQPWEYDLYLDGSATVSSPIGIRSVFVDNCQFFGASTEFKTVYLNNIVHGYFSNFEVIQAPATGNVGLWIDNTTTEDVSFVSARIFGKLRTAAAGGLVFVGRVPDTVECVAGSANNVFVGDIGTFVNSGATSNVLWSKGPQARVRHNANQSIANNTPTALAFNTEGYDDRAMHDTVTNNSRVIPTIPGVYRGAAHVEWAANATGERECNVRLNGSATIASDRRSACAAGTTVQSVPFSWNFNGTTDYVEVVVTQSSGGALNVNLSGGYQCELEIARAY